jgi:hypothetical protein
MHGVQRLAVLQAIARLSVAPTKYSILFLAIPAFSGGFVDSIILLRTPGIANPVRKGYGH